MSEVFLVSGNAGQGKSSVASNLAVALRGFGFDVLLVDSDLRSPKLGHSFGLPLVERTVQGVLRGFYSCDSAVYFHSSGLKLLLSGLSVQDCDHPVKLLPELRKLADVIVVDVPSFDFNWLDSKCSVVLVSHADFPSVLDLGKISKRASVKGVVVNRFFEGDLSVNNIREFLSCDVLGVVPDSSVFRESLRVGYPVLVFNPDCPVSISFKSIAAKLMNLEYSSPVKRSRWRGLLNARS